jgi:hypothetical protein
MGLWLGYDSAFELEFPGAAFPPGATFRAQIRPNASSAQLLGELATATGTIERIDGEIIRFNVPGTMSKDWTVTRVVLDAVRTDLVPPMHLNVQVEATFDVPATRPAA